MGADLFQKDNLKRAVFIGCVVINSTAVEPILWLIDKSRSNRIFVQVVHALIENWFTVE